MELIQTELFAKKITENGYVKIFVGNFWIYEHRYIMERLLNRELKEEEKIHHINGFKTDNRIDNLMLFENQKAHAKFHQKIKQFGYTKPIIRQINDRWKILGIDI